MLAHQMPCRDHARAALTAQLEVDKHDAALQSEGVLVGNRRSLLERSGLLPMVHELLERLEAHLTADKYYSVTVNMRGDDPAAIAADMRAAGMGGLQGPTVSKVRKRLTCMLRLHRLRSSLHTVRSLVRARFPGYLL